MASPSDVPACPPWLEQDPVSGAYWPREDFLAGIAESGDTLESWLEWRSRVAAALGLVEPARPRAHDDAMRRFATTMLNTLAELHGKKTYAELSEEQAREVQRQLSDAIASDMEEQKRRMAAPFVAAELRRWMGEFEYLSADDMARLRARADELDPPG